MNIYERIEKVVENTDWSVYINKDNHDVEFSAYTPAGQDFNFSIEVDEEDDLSDIADKINEYVDDFDPDYEASLWIGEDGHGKNGAPYHVKDIVKDMEKAEEMMKELADKFIEE